MEEQSVYRRSITLARPSFTYRRKAKRTGTCKHEECKSAEYSRPFCILDRRIAQLLELSLSYFVCLREQDEGYQANVAGEYVYDSACSLKENRKLNAGSNAHSKPQQPGQSMCQPHA